MHGSIFSETKNNTVKWKEINDKENIKVYSTEVSGSDILKIKTQTIIHAPILVIQSILDNVKHRKNWIPYLQKSSIIEVISDTEKVEYSLFSAPWPASDRDFVYKLTQISSNKLNITYNMSSVQYPHKPISTQMIRADLMESTYILTALSPETTQVELIFHADPKGWLPNWIVNIIQRVLPYLILRNLREQATIK
jgi:START domain